MVERASEFLKVPVAREVWGVISGLRERILAFDSRRFDEVGDFQNPEG